MLKKPPQCLLKSIGFQTQIHWISNSNPLDFKVESIGFQSQIHWISNLNPLGLAEKRGELGKGGELGMVRDVSQCALRLMNGRVLSARPLAKQASPVASHVTLFGFQLRRLSTTARPSLAFGSARLITNARSCLTYGCAHRSPVWPSAALTAEISKKTCNLL